jgi:tetratricopeptide (TPR) repeat protein
MSESKSSLVKIWVEEIIIPTYSAGKPEKNPMFFEKRVYQGSSGVVYPHPIIEKIYDRKVDKIYKAVYLENKYLKIMILPELGGRVQMAFDKIRQKHFVYYNQVIKPALVGLAGPWISGGIEFNWPQHHRPSTFDPVDFTLTENADGSKTIWVNEVERMFRTKGMAGFTLYPDKAYLEVTGKIYNRTPFPQTFLWWSNPAVKVSDDYQSVFPPDVNAVYDHGKRDVSSFPIATGTYYKIDYSAGVDISRYKNIPVPTSYMAVNSKYDFLGGYDHSLEHGLLHIANHHVSPGKKQWTWGNKEFGLAWERNLTDSDGPYIELMTGVFTDNQPDFSWLQPYEEKEFTQYFMPYSKVGMVKNATKEAIVNIEFEKNQAIIKLYTTAIYNNLEISLYQSSEIIFKETFFCSPETPLEKRIDLDQALDIKLIRLIVRVPDNDRILVSYRHEVQNQTDIPNPANAVKAPREVESIEKLYLIGLHLEQYRHATYNAIDYYHEGLKRDKSDIRCNNALGLSYLKKGKIDRSIKYFKTAIRELTALNSNPQNGEVYYNLGLALKMSGQAKEAYDAFYKCTWNDAFQHAGFLQLARLELSNHNYETAFENIEKSLVRNSNSNTARHIKVISLRKLERLNEALEIINETLSKDSFHLGCLYEKCIIQSESGKENESKTTLIHLLNISRNWVHNFIEYALDYAHCGLYKEAESLLNLHVGHSAEVYPMIYYYMGWFRHCQLDEEGALEFYRKAGLANPDYCFPNRVEDVQVLENAVRSIDSDSKAYYYLGNFWYDKGQHVDAIVCWSKSIERNDQFPTVLRNMALAAYNKLENPEQALKLLSKAFSIDKTDARTFMELHQLHKKINTPLEQRFKLLETYADLVKSRQDLVLEKIASLNQLGEYKKARELLAKYKFHPWEGGEGKVIRQFNISHVQLAKKAMSEGKYSEALEYLNDTDSYPENIGEGKLFNSPNNEIDYWKAVAYEMIFEKEKSLEYYNKASNGFLVPALAIFYNDTDPANLFYQGMALNKMGKTNEAKAIFNRLIEFGSSHLNDESVIDYFAVSLPDMLIFDSNINQINKIQCNYMMGLGYLGLGDEFKERAIDCLNEVLLMDINHQGASIHQDGIQEMIGKIVR